jgi:glycerol-3-phosphate dehydrogenase
VRHLIDREWARTAEDILWRRTKLGLKLSEAEAGALQAWLDHAADGKRAAR